MENLSSLLAVSIGLGIPLLILAATAWLVCDCLWLIANKRNLDEETATLRRKRIVSEPHHKQEG